MFSFNPVWLMPYKKRKRQGAMMLEWGVCMYIHKWRSDDSLWCSLFSFYCVVSRDWTRVVRLGSKSLNLLSHLASPFTFSLQVNDVECLSYLAFWAVLFHGVLLHVFCLCLPFYCLLKYYIYYGYVILLDVLLHYRACFLYCCWWSQLGSCTC